MAFGGSQYGGSFTTNCLDDIPFKLGPKFKIPSKVVLPPHLTVPLSCKALDAEYSFEVEEAVLKWSEERAKQLAEQKRLEQEFADSAQNNAEPNDDENDGKEPIYENQPSEQQPVYENMHRLPKPGPKPAPRKSKPQNVYANVLVPNPLLANFTNGILQPTPSSSSPVGGSKTESNGNTKTETDKTKNSGDLDLTWFEKEDDPFDNLELQTINDLEELASVLEETKKASPEPNQTKIVDTDVLVETDSVSKEDDNSDDPMYENVELKMVNLKLGATENPSQNVPETSGMSSLENLPPVPPRRDLIGRSPPLPPIGQASSEPSLPTYVNQSLDISSKNEDTDSKQTFQSSANSKNISKRRAALPKPLPKPPRAFTYSRHIGENDEDDQANEPNYDNLQPKVSINTDIGKPSSVQFTTNHAFSDSKLVRSSSEELHFVNHHYGEELSSGPGNKGSNVKPRIPQRPAPELPARPQSWARYSPLPPTPSPRPTEDRPRSTNLPCYVAIPESTSTVGQDLYNRLTKEAQGCVDKLTSMGFPRDRVARAVQKLGQDEKEVVEYLCLVDQLIEKGYNTYLAENALLLFQNSMQQACSYLDLYTQMQELGFNGEKIKEALVNANNDREKALDILTASS